MLNILIPLGGSSLFFETEEYVFPKPLIEIRGKSMIETVIDNLSSIAGEKRFIFIVHAQHCAKYHLDNVLRILVPRCEIIMLDGDTKGAVCSALLAVDFIDTEDALIISNGDQIIDASLNDIIASLSKEADAAVVGIDTVHPRWSYARLDEAGWVVEAAEKRPISRHAIAGFYYFKKGKNFVHAAMQSIKKESVVDDLYYVAPTLNELILENKKIAYIEISKERYHTFYSPQKIKEFEEKSHTFLDALTKTYIRAFSNKDLDAVAALMADDVALEDPVVKRIEGKKAVLEAVAGIFNGCKKLSFREKKLFQDGNTTFIEFVLKLDETVLEGMDIIVWEHNKIKELRAYLDIPK